MWTEFIQSSTGYPFEWGRHDCMTDVGDWVTLNTGLNTQKYRNSYHTEEECRALFRRRGGLVRVMRKDFAEAGLKETEEPQVGDIALVRCFEKII